MKKVLFVALLSALGFQLSAVFAQQVTISPIPQSITWGDKAFDGTGQTYAIQNMGSGDTYAISAIRKAVTVADDGERNIYIGTVADEGLAIYKGKVPASAQGYWIKLTADSIIVIGRDADGCFYGAQTLIPILKQKEVYSVTVRDYPATTKRGVIEGFYGNPWSTADRESQFDFYGANKMNTYVYGPKDDPYHRSQWRVNYPEAEGSVIRQLAARAKQNHVHFVWAIHTGGSMSATESDYQAVVEKFENVYSLGVRSFSMFFDDFGTADATMQSAVLNYVYTNFVLKHDDVEGLSMCPTKYNAAYAGWSSSDSYLQGLGSNLNSNIEIMWTGNSVVDMINSSDIDFFNTATGGRKPFIWLNYPVNDYCIGHMLMGKFYGNDTGDNTFGGRMAAFTSNPMEYAEASKVALYGVADYSWNMKKYDAESNWERGIKYLMPRHPFSYHVFCENNVDLGSTTHGLRREGESPNFDTSASRSEILKQYNLMVNCADTLLSDTYNPNLITEITPWLMKMKYMGQRGQLEQEMWDCIENGDTAKFIADYKQIKVIQTSEDALISRNFDGTIKSAKPIVADQKVAPYLKQQLNELVIEYKKKYPTGWENFPAVVLESGTYYIKVNGKYLTNVNASATKTGDYPKFKYEIDDTKPQKCEWEIQQDASTGRYKITNVEDGRYLNEKGAFWSSSTTNPYDAAWHSYNIYRINGKYAIQNAGSAGTKFWTANYTRISAGTSTALRYHDAIFELVPVSGDTIVHPTVDRDHTYYIMYDGKALKLTSSTAGTAPKFLAKGDNKYCKWAIVPDAAYGRWKIVPQYATSKFLDEKATVNKNSYYSDWNSFALCEREGKWAIQAVTPDASNYLGISASGTTITMTPGSASLDNSYLFTIEKADTLIETSTAPTVPTGYKEVFAEDFDGEGEPTSEFWSRTARQTSATWARFCSDDSRVVYQKDGYLHCLTIPNDYRTADEATMLSGGIKTQDKFSFRYGRVVARIRTNSYTGSFPAFWMMPQTNTYGGWPYSGELDIWEASDVDQKAYGSLHTQWTYVLQKGGNTSNMTGIDYTQWHTYRMDWTASSITWYVDGTKMWSYSKSTTQSELDQGQWPFDIPFYIILNQSVGNTGALASAPDVNHTYETLVDWVRVYQKPEDVTGIDSLTPDSPLQFPSKGTEAPNREGSYDLQGRKVTDLQHGIYIINGRKVIR